MVQVPRRQFLRNLGALAALPMPLLAQPRRKQRIGVVDNTTPLADLSGPIPNNPAARSLVEALAERGRIDGKDIEIVWRSAEENYERRPGLIAELVRLPVDVIVVYGNIAAREALAATRTIPIVMASSLDPVNFKLVASLARPGGNLTGLDLMPDKTFQGKRLSLLKEAAPSVTRVAVFLANYTIDGPFWPQTLEAASALGMTLVTVRMDGPDPFEKAFAAAMQQGVNGLALGGDSALSAPRNQAIIRGLVERHRLPAIHTAADKTEAGAILNYGPDSRISQGRAAFYVDRILAGTKAGDLPIERQTAPVLVVNKRAAKAIGVTLPSSILAQADRIID